MAPAFTSRNQYGAAVTSADLLGSVSILFFYPWAFSRICTAELAGLTNASSALGEAGIAVQAISCDPMFSLRAFAEAESITYGLLTDWWPHGEISRAYGVFDAVRGCALRGTFVLDPDNRITWSEVVDVGSARDIDQLVRLAVG